MELVSVEVIAELGTLQPGSPSVVTVGVFDGVHVGHQAIMRKVAEDARQCNVRSVAITFDRNPSKAPCITTLRQKLDLIAAQGVDLTLVLPLERHILDITAEDFISGILHRKLKAEQVVIGSDFQFGRDRRGNADLLREMGGKLHFDVDVVPPVIVEDTVVSSTVIRQLVSSGNVEKAEVMLGRPFAIDGVVVAGNGIGRTLGFPTANIQAAECQVIPGEGVYSVSVDISGEHLIGVASIGTRPTLGFEGVAVEVYIIGFSGDLYEQDLEVAFHRRLRGQVKFANIDELKQQIGLDVERVIRLGL